MVTSGAGDAIVSVFDTVALTDAIAHVLPRFDVATIVVAPAASPATSTAVSVWPAAITADAAGDAIEPSIAVICTLRSVASGAGRNSRRLADPPSGTPSSRARTPSPVVTGTIT